MVKMQIITERKGREIMDFVEEWGLTSHLLENYREEMWETFEENTDRHFKEVSIWMNSTKEVIVEAFGVTLTPCDVLKYWLLEFYADILMDAIYEEGWHNDSISIGLVEE